MLIICSLECLLRNRRVPFFRVPNRLSGSEEDAMCWKLFHSTQHNVSVINGECVFERDLSTRSGCDTC